ncbi:CSL zinc finger [Phlyctema vagabunda]|uniref:Diphthamide biosynthesis protein 4 n=1 Tax=Phlyctema vagabunda TaxID=108571 RepID=A0ABR4PK71_9HELO
MTTFYEILGIPKALQDDSGISAQTIRSAYRRALLQNHPDKSGRHEQPKLSAANPLFSIDQISEAFSTLSNPKSRAQYDKELKLRATASHNREGENKDIFRTGVEVVDLDDLNTDEADGTWYRSCRCGDDQGFLIREEDLEEAADEGEISVGCRGCSLWMRVLFGVMEEDTSYDAAKEQAPCNGAVLKSQ